MRVSMEGEKDDIQFFFRRGFRSLKRAEADMPRIFINKVSFLLLFVLLLLSERLLDVNNVFREML